MRISCLFLWAVIRPKREYSNALTTCGSFQGWLLSKEWEQLYPRPGTGEMKEPHLSSKVLTERTMWNWHLVFTLWRRGSHTRQGPLGVMCLKQVPIAVCQGVPVWGPRSTGCLVQHMCLKVSVSRWETSLFLDDNQVQAKVWKRLQSRTSVRRYSRMQTTLRIRLTRITRICKLFRQKGDHSVDTVGWHIFERRLPAGAAWCW
jgi:hypothetical protein